MAPLWIHALYWLFAGLAVLALVGWFLDGSDTRHPEVHHPKPKEPSNHLSTRCPSCFGPTNPLVSDCTVEWCATWKRDQKTSPNYIVSPPNQTRAS